MQTLGYWLGLNLGKGLLGSMWLGVGIALTMFFVEYNRLWYRGVRLGKKDCLMAFTDMERNVRRIAITLLMYLLMSYVLLVLFTKGFLDCVARGAIVSAICFPLLNSHYN